MAQLNSPLPLDFDRISSKLYIGSAPPLGSAVASYGFHTLVLCAQEFQPRQAEFPGVRVVHAGIDDSSDLLMDHWETARQASKVVAARVGQGQRTLVTCWLGQNRSGLVCALALHRLTSLSPEECVFAVQRARQGALFNDHFVELICSLG